MTDVLNPIWPLFEADDTTLTAMGWLRLPVTTRQALEATGLAKSAGYSERIPCPACATAHIERVITKPRKDGSARYYILCPREMRVEVDDRHRQRWRLDVLALSKAIAASAGLAGEVKPVSNDRLILLGQHEFRGVRADVYLARGLGRKDASSVIAALPSSVVPPIVFVPSTSPPEDAWGQMPPRVFPLASCHTYIDGVVGVDQRVLDIAMRQHLQGDLTPDYLFRCRGECWEVAFEGSEIKLFKNTIGLRYIARILREPDRILRAVHLLATEAGVDPLSASGTSGEVIDPEGLKKMRQQYQYLQAEMAEAELLNDMARMGAAQSEQEALGVELAKLLDRRGNAREATDAERVRYVEEVELALDKPVRVIVIVRDVRDVLASMERLYRQRDLAYPADMPATVEERCELWLSPQGVVGNAARLVQDAIRRIGNRLLVVSYEDLTTQPIQVLSGLATQLGLPPYDYDSSDVQQITHENDAIHGMDLHRVRPHVEPNSHRWSEVLPVDYAATVSRRFAWLDPFLNQSMEAA